MKKDEVQNRIKTIISKGYKPEIYAVLKSNEVYTLKRLLAVDALVEQIKDSVDKLLTEQIFAEDFDMDDSSRIEENKKIFYEIGQDENYKPFSFLNNMVSEDYKETDQPFLKGFIIKVNLNTDHFWIYQHKYPVTLINKKTSIYALLNGQNRYEPLTVDVVRFDNKMDLLIIGNSIITKKINLLQSDFGFDKYIRTEADKELNKINTFGILSTTDTLRNMLSGSKLTTAKKLLNIKNSKAMSLSKEELYTSIKKHSYYKDKFQFNEDNHTLVINSQKDANLFLKMINDDFLHSELTGADYETNSKHAL